MDNHYVQLVGGPCGQHGPYTFYKAFKFVKNGEKRIMTLSEFFFVKLWMDSDLVCIGELQLLWMDKNSEQVLASLRLYFLPENTPEGRMDHGEDEVLAISEKVVLRVEDLITWITLDAEWGWGRSARYVRGRCDPSLEIPEPKISARLTESSLDFSDVERERKLSDIKPPKGPSVIILSYPRYCRYRAILKRLEGVEDDQLKHRFVNALGGIRVKNDNTKILYCRDTFDYPELEGHELLCNHLAPKLKGRPRGKRKKRSISPGSESNESESSVSNVFNSGKNKLTISGGRNGLRCDRGATRRSTRSSESNAESQDFVKRLTAFMKKNKTPIGRIPSLGYRELDLYSFYTKVERIGGYEAVTQNRLWKSIFDDLSGHQTSTSAATVIRRHYERFLLSYEKHLKGGEYNKLLATTDRRRLKSKTGSSTSMSDAESSEGTSRSGNSTPVPQLQTPSTSTPSTPTECKDFMGIKVETTKSLRSVRVKPERMRDMKEIGSSATAPSSNMQPEEEVVLIKEENKIPEKDPEPSTGAVAPVQIISPEKSTSPAEGKENIPIYNDENDVHTKTSSSNNCPEDADLVEVPYKPKSPEIIDLESDKYTSKSNNNNTISITNHANHINNNNNNCTTNNNKNAGDVKKGKLDILKEGGLEVTPVRNFPPQLPIRTSTIHKMSIEKHHMPPPSINASLIKRPSPMATPPLKSAKYQFNYNTPPKVVQSKSIYTPSQMTVYGDPKDIIQPQIHQVQTPKFIGGPPAASGTSSGTYKPITDLLDLTVKSPQKAADYVRAPPVIPPKLQSNGINRYGAPSLPLLEGRRLNHNLEITLVGPNGQRTPPMTSPQLPPHLQHPQSPQLMHHQQQQQVPQVQARPHKKQRHHSSSSSTSSTSKHQQYKLPPTAAPTVPSGGHKRALNDYYASSSKAACVEENGKQQRLGNASAVTNLYAPPMYNASKSKSKFAPTSPSMLLPNFPMPPTAPVSSAQSKGIPPPYLIDPMYYQSLYNNSRFSTPLPFPMPGGPNMPYLSLFQNLPMWTDSHASIASNDSKVKKP
ncbi:AT-rich interactive domain-containing protein 5B-like [Atheta coriaria]|uniref:AT-rich interactive domain-containing protein 5B-like n=1 Tax=Dalotia coriaria TaxID=877792 RepID=UPI0031F35212